MFLFHKNMIMSIGIDIENMKAQNYDGASNMLGEKSGVWPRLLKEYPFALYSIASCLCYSLNLSVSSINKVSRSMKDMMDVCIEMTRLLKFSPKRERGLGKIRFI